MLVGNNLRGPKPNLNSPNQLAAFGQDCRKCSLETGMSSDWIEEDCEYSFDLCFECTEAAVGRNVTDFSVTDPFWKSRMLAARKMSSNGQVTTNPPTEQILASMAPHPYANDSSALLFKPIPRRANVARPQHHELDASTSRLLSPRRNQKKEIQMIDTPHNNGHQLAAFAQDCMNCSSVRGISVVCVDENCVDEDCEFSFDLCFECAPDTAAARVSKPLIQSKREFFRDTSSYPVFSSYSM